MTCSCRGGSDPRSRVRVTSPVLFGARLVPPDSGKRRQRKRRAGSEPNWPTGPATASRARLPRLALPDGQKEEAMPGGSGMGFGRGRGGGGGRGAGGGFGGGRGRMGGPRSAGPGGECVCPNCGERVPHVAGQPCNQMKCPKCGTTMTRA